MTAKIEPWMIDAMKSLHCAEYYTDAMAERDARHIAAHAPKQEWEAGAGTKMTTKLQRYYPQRRREAMTTPAKIEPWMIDAMKSLHCAEYYTDAMAERDAILIQDIVAIIENHQTLEGLNPNVTPGLALLAQYEDREKRLASALREIHATVKGECPSLLDEDTPGNARLDLEIESLLTEQEKP